MSNGADLSRLVLDALLWDVPRLSGAEEPGAMNFLNAFNRRLPPDFEPSLNDPLDLAAGVVVRVMTGQDEAARATLDQLFAGTDEAVALAIFLRAWLPSSDD